MAKTQMYYVAVNTKDGVKFVTSLGDHNTAYWEDGKDAMKMSKEMAKGMVIGLMWNGFIAMAVLDINYEYHNQ